MGVLKWYFLSVLLNLGIMLVKNETNERMTYRDPENQLSPNFLSADEYNTEGQRALENFPLVDGHNDLAMNLNRLYKNQLTHFNFSRDINDPEVQLKCGGFCHTDLPKLKTGKIGAQFWSAYIDCKNPGKDPVANTIEQIDVIKRMAKKYPNDLMFATKAEDIEIAFQQNKIASFIGVEGGHSIANKLSVLRAYYDFGVRYMTLTHVCDLPWADSATVDLIPDSKKKNLTDFGKKVILEMNRLGMMVDLAHVSKGVMLEAIKTSRAPVIFSHSSSQYVKDHVRNVDDEVLKELKKNEGIIMVNFVPGFIKENNSTIADVCAHINHIVDKIGSDYVGVGGDFDGIKKTIYGLENVSKYPELFNLLREGSKTKWSLPKLEKLAGRNFVRVMKRVEQVRDELAQNEEITEDILEDDFYIIPV